MPFASGVYTRFKTFVNSGNILPSDLNSIQDELGAAGQSLLKRTILISLPGSPYDGQEILYQTTAMITAGIGPWAFIYRAGSGSAYKWEFIGGDPWIAEVAASQTSFVGVFGDMDTVGPQIALPALAGDYLIEHGSESYSNAANTGGIQSFAVGATAASENDRAIQIAAANACSINIYRAVAKLAVPSSSMIKVQYRVIGNGVATFSNRWLKITPLRVG